MKEVTKIITLQLTAIARMTDEDAAVAEERREKSALPFIKKIQGEYRIDDAILLDEKLFIRDIEEEETP